MSNTESEQPEDQATAGNKRQRAEARRRAAEQKAANTKLKRYALIAFAIIVPLLWWVDRRGPEEIVSAEVIQTQSYQHVNEKSGPHTHLRATILIDGRAEEDLQRADNYVRGQQLEVWIRRGRISNYPYYIDIVRGEELMSSEGGS